MYVFTLCSYLYSFWLEIVMVNLNGDIEKNAGPRFHSVHHLTI